MAEKLIRRDKNRKTSLKQLFTREMYRQDCMNVCRYYRIAMRIIDSDTDKEENFQ